MSHSHGSRSTLGQASSLSSSQVFETNAVQRGVDTCKRRREQECYTPTLPKEIIFDILVLLPAEVLHDVMRHVCRDWRNIVSDPAFRRTHLSLSSTGVIVQDNKGQILYLETDNGELKIREFAIPSKTFIVLGSCHGLLLVRDRMDGEVLRVFNPITKVTVPLPPLVGFCKSYIHRYTALAFSSSGHCKAVHVRIESNSEVWIMICTMGIDKAWRKIDARNVTMSTSLVDVVQQAPYSSGRLIWWDYVSTASLVLDVDDETMHQLLTPSGGLSSTGRISMTIKLGTSLGWVVTVIPHKGRQRLWEVWEVISMSSGEWTKVAVVDVTDLGNRLETIFHPLVLRFSYPFLYSKKKGELWLRCLVNELHFGVLECQQWRYFMSN